MALIVASLPVYYSERESCIPWRIPWELAIGALRPKAKKYFADQRMRNGCSIGGLAPKTICVALNLLLTLSKFAPRSITSTINDGAGRVNQNTIFSQFP